MFKNRVLTIIFILVTAAVIVGFIGLKQYSEFKQENYLKPAIARNDIVKIMTALLIYEQEEGSLPDQKSFNRLQTFKSETNTIYQIPPVNDPWGNPYIYKVPGPDDLPYQVLSYGADGEPGGAGKDQDLSSIPVYLKYKTELNNSMSPDTE